MSSLTSPQAPLYVLLSQLSIAAPSTPPPAQEETPCIEPNQYDIPSETLSIGFALQKILDRHPSIKCTINELTSIHYALQETETLIDEKNPDGTLAHYTDTLVEKTSQGIAISHYQGESKKQKTFYYSLWQSSDREKTLHVTIPILCTATFTILGMTHSLSFVHPIQTKIHAPFEPLSDRARNNFKNVVISTFLAIQQFETVEKVQADATSHHIALPIPPVPPRIKQFSFRGFAKKMSPASREKIYQRFFDDYPAFWKEAHAQCVRPKGWDPIPTLSPKTPPPLIDHLQMAEKVRQACLEYFHNQSIPHIIPSLLLSIPYWQLDELGRREIQCAIETGEELVEVMQTLFDTIDVHPTTHKTTYSLKKDHEEQHNRWRPFLETFERYNEFQKIKESFLVTRDSIINLEDERNEQKEILEANQKKLQIPLSETEKIILEHKIADLSSSLSSLNDLIGRRQQELPRLLQTQTRLEEKYNTNKTALKIQVRALYKKMIDQKLLSWGPSLEPETVRKMKENFPVLDECLIEDPSATSKVLLECTEKHRNKTMQQIEIIRRQRAYHRTFLVERLILAQAKYEAIQKSKTIIHVFQTALKSYTFTAPLKEALTLCQFDEIGNALQFLESTLRNSLRTTSEEIDPFAKKPLWEIPQAPSIL